MVRRPLIDALNPPERTVTRKFLQLNWGLIALISIVAAVGFAMLYSAANGDWSPWAHRQMIRYGVGLAMAICVALIDLRLLMKWSYATYGMVLVMLAAVEVAGEIGMGAQRWIDLGIFQLQPSELMKIALVLALARYFHGLTYEDVARPHFLLVPLAMVAAPVVLVLRQPDLGTAGMILLGSGAIFFLAGVRIWKFVTLLVIGMGSVPIAWQFLRDYQKNRILTFLDPESDPLGSGYHILQSKIALGSGGIFGKGFMQGSQSHLNFLPEKQTDFIFTMLAEEFGLIGGLGLIGLFLLITFYGIAIGLRAQTQFARLLALGVTTTLFLYVFINIAMVMGLVPVVGVPLPLISYGGTAMLTAMVAIGLMMSAYVHRDLRINRQGVVEE
ncbi:MAG: rod shape-determining protein RodA [Alphaproteobacteria bacterium]|nr:rod shape-determining protein RodA [Alphaproteobacteria bacterium]